jgi:hypothetical protein
LQQLSEFSGSLTVRLTSARSEDLQRKAQYKKHLPV